MLCNKCEAIGYIPDKFWGNIWSADQHDPDHYIIGHSEKLSTVQETAEQGCHLCNLIIAALEEAAKLSKNSTDSFINDPVRLHFWRDRTHNTITGDDRDECRIDPFCTAADTSDFLEILQGKAEGILLKGELRCTLSPLKERTKDTGSSPTNTTTASEETLNLIRVWWNICMRNHQTCRQIYKNLPQLPTRVIDVGSEATGTSKLVTTDHKPGTYIALSHCWGSAQPLKTELLTLPDRLAGIKDAELPPTFRDAVHLCRRLGIEYLWIDSLCIIQDSPEDWRTEAAVMGKVYSHAACTLAAISAPDSNGGLFWPRNGSANFACHTMIFGKMCLVERHPNLIEEVYGDLRIGSSTASPLLTRAWVLQEQVLAGRTIGFKDDGVYWNCSDKQASEKYQMGLPGIPQRRMDVWAGLRDIINGTGLCQGSVLKARIFGLWYRTIMDYSTKKLTRATDIFPAISGLAEVFGRAISDEYYMAGLWATDMNIGLLWLMDPSSQRSKDALERHRAQGHLDLDEEIFYTRQAKVLSYDIEPLHKDYLMGELVSAKLLVEGSLIAAALPEEEPTRVRMQTGRSAPVRRLIARHAASEELCILSCCHFDSDSPQADIYVLCPMVITHSKIPNYDDATRHWALIMEPVADQAQVYRRAGVCELAPEEASVFEGAVNGKFVLV